MTVKLFTNIHLWSKTGWVLRVSGLCSVLCLFQLLANSRQTLKCILEPWWFISFVFHQKKMPHVNTTSHHTALAQFNILETLFPGSRPFSRSQEGWEKLIRLMRGCWNNSCPLQPLPMKKKNLISLEGPLEHGDENKSSKKNALGMLSGPLESLEKNTLTSAVRQVVYCTASSHFSLIYLPPYFLYLSLFLFFLWPNLGHIALTHRSVWKQRAGFISHQLRAIRMPSGAESGPGRTPENRAAQTEPPAGWPQLIGSGFHQSD